MEKVSVVVPTYNRSLYMKGLVSCFQKQTYPNIELLVSDDSDQYDEWLGSLSSLYDNIHYFYHADRLTTGTKINQLVEQSQGSIIVKFDDDDFYAPNYIAEMAYCLGEGDFLTLSRWFAYSVRHQSLFYWATDYNLPTQYVVSPEMAEIGHLQTGEMEDTFIEQNLWGYGFSYVFRKRVFEKVRFPDKYFGEDYDFYCDLVKNGYSVSSVADDVGLVLHMLHTTNMSKIFPQYIIPPNLMGNYFPQIEAHFKPVFNASSSHLSPSQESPQAEPV